MALPTTGPLSLSMVNVELGYPSNRQISLGDAAVRALAGRPSGAISFSHLRGKSASTVINVTVGILNLGKGIVFYGFSNINQISLYGSRTPTTLNGATIRALSFGNAVVQVTIAGNRPKNFFSTVQFQGDSVRTSASATYTQGQDYATWSWTAAVPSIWQTNGVVRTVTFT